MTQVVEKKVTLNLKKLDGNAFAVLGDFQASAKKEGWTKEEISKVQDEAMNGDYNHLLATIQAHCK